jgi:spore coat protein U-like protein
MRTIKTILMVVAMMLAATAGFAQTQSSNSAGNDDNITATVIGNCWIDTFDLDFGDYDPIDQNDKDADTTVDVYCTKGVTPEVTLDNGVNTSRRMTDGTDFLDYELYSGSAGGTVWPTVTPGVAAGTAANPTIALTLTIYGRLFAEQAVQAGNYVDTVVATVNW